MTDIPPHPLLFFSPFSSLGTGRRRRKRRRGRRGWGGNRTSKLGGGEQLRRGELLADEEEEELEDKRLREMEIDGGGVEVRVGVTEEDADGSCGARVKGESVVGMEGVEGEGLVKEGTREAVVEGAGLQGQVVKVDMEEAEAEVGVEQELELDEEAFSDDDLL